MVAATQQFVDQCALEPGHAARLAIVVEELVMNLVEHGGIGEDGLIELAMTHDGEVIHIVLSDTGPAFDPRGGASPDAEIPERGGGAGIDLVLAWTEVLDYETHTGRNWLRLRMSLS